ARSRNPRGPGRRRGPRPRGRMVAGTDPKRNGKQAAGCILGFPSYVRRPGKGGRTGSGRWNLHSAYPARIGSRTGTATLFLLGISRRGRKAGRDRGQVERNSPERKEITRRSVGAVRPGNRSRRNQGYCKGSSGACHENG